MIDISPNSKNQCFSIFFESNDFNKFRISFLVDLYPNLKEIWLDFYDINKDSDILNESFLDFIISDFRNNKKKMENLKVIQLRCIPKSIKNSSNFESTLLEFKKFNFEIKKYGNIISLIRN